MLLLVSVSLFAIILAADVVNYTYDDAGRLTKVDYGNGKAITYAYDKAGNLLKREVTAGASASTASATKGTVQRLKSTSRRK